VYTEGSIIKSRDIEAQREQKSSSPEIICPPVSFSNQVTDFRIARINFEKEFLKKALESNNGNITATARSIGMAQSNLSRKLKELGIEK
jgi:DNA-binding NtrC family response regulator